MPLVEFLIARESRDQREETMVEHDTPKTVAPIRAIRGRLGCCIAALALAAGCGPRHPPVYKAGGTVSYKGQPVADADVVFLPASGPLASGKTDAQGKFELRTPAIGAGAVAGEHRVTVTKNVAQPTTPENPYPQTRNELPARYAVGAQSPLSATVTDQGPNDFPFELQD